MSTKKLFEKEVKDVFGYTPVSLTENIDYTGEDLIPALVQSSNFLSKVNVDEGVINKKVIKLLDGDATLQELTDCGLSDAGNVTFSQVIVETKPIGIEVLLCNQDLRGTWAQLLLRSGAKQSLQDLPAEQQVLALMTAKLRKKAQDLLINGDVDSSNPELAIFDGLKKKLQYDTTIPYHPSSGAVSASNALAYVKGVYRKIAAEVWDNEIPIEIVVSNVDFNHLVDNLEANDSFNYSTMVQGEGNDRSLVIPNTTIRVTVLPQLATGEIFAMPYNYIVVGTNLASDLAGVTAEYLVESREIRIDALMDLGINYAYGKYFARLGEPLS